MNDWMDDAERAALLASVAETMRMIATSPAAPVRATPAATPPPPTRFRIRYGVVYCELCGLSSLYCKGHGPPDAQSADGAESSLARRIADARRDAGGR